MATQTDVQQLIQGLTPSGVNNGNPNTAYNSPMPPVMDAFGNWSAPQVSRAANVTVNRGVPQALPQATPTRVGFLPPLPPLNLNPNWATPRPPVVTPPLTDPVAPPVTPPLTPPVTSVIPPALPPQLNTGGGTGGLSNFDMGSIINQFSNNPNFYSGTSGASGGTINWQQLIDAVSEPLLGGNLYLSGTGAWDTSNILASLGSAITGLPINSVMNSLGQYMEGRGMNNFLTDHFLDNDVNETQNMYNDLIASGEISNQPVGWMADLNGGASPSTLTDTQHRAALLNAFGPNVFGTSGLSSPAGLPTYGATSNSDWVSRHNAATTGGGGASSIGGYYRAGDGSIQFDDAGQQAFAAMKLAALAKGEFQTGADILGRQYQD